MTTCYRALRLAPLAVLLAAPALARELHWRAIDVVAELEADGSLRVAETQTLVMSGDWNGGERVFRLEPGQRLELIGLTRIAPDGTELPLREGDLDAVDEYAWHDRRTLRWRSRLPSDPPFADAELVYRLEFRYRGVLAELDAGRYRLDHDFVFRERDGAIERFRLALEVAPGWQVEEPLPAAFEAGPLPPGEGFVLTRSLRWSGPGVPAAATVTRATPATRWAALALLAAAALERLVAWLRRDRALGRFRAPHLAVIDRAWLEANVLVDPPEVVGAAWDRAIGRAEVAATLARLVAEGKLTSRVERRGWGVFGRDELHLRREVPLDEIDAGARPLVAALFPLGAETDTASLRAHYRSQGFDPVSKLRGDLERRVARLRGFAAGSPKPRRAPTLLLLAAGAVALLAAAASDDSPLQGFGLAVLLLVVALPGWLGAGIGGRRLGWPVGGLLTIGASLTAAALVLDRFGRGAGVSDLELAGGALLAAGWARSFFNLLATRESAAALARRHELAAARQWLRAELRRARPQLDDRWLPWLVAFGLAPEMDRWFRAWGGAARAGAGGLAGGGGHGGGGWSGGGGAFGGAGATASFAAAVSTMAAGVPAPSSSGGGGGGGGGGSSGGGGGGGW